MSNAQQIARLRKATGLGWLNARLFLLGKSPVLCERIVTAKETQSGMTLHDPIEDSPSLSAALDDATAEAEKALSNWLSRRREEFRNKGQEHLVEKRPRGACHFIWSEKKKVLWEKHRIEWFSPAEMNPGHRFD